MKKNFVLRLGVLALVLTLITMPLVSGTYAKYVTQAEGSATARVAKWGVVIDSNMGGVLFAKEYYSNANDQILTVQSEDYVVAPGTSGTLAGLVISGVPEVAGRIEITGEISLGEGVVGNAYNWRKYDGNGGYYNPLVIIINNQPIYGMETRFTHVNGSNINQTSQGDANNAFKAAIKDAFYNEDGDAIISLDFEPGTDLSSLDLTSLANLVQWEWAYDKDTAGEITNRIWANNVDLYDTRLANRLFDFAAGTEHPNKVPKVNFKLTVRILQID